MNYTEDLTSTSRIEVQPNSTTLLRQAVFEVKAYGSIVNLKGDKSKRRKIGNETESEATDQNMVESTTFTVHL
jgi:hypothetical protein